MAEESLESRSKRGILSPILMSAFLCMPIPFSADRPSLLHMRSLFCPSVLYLFSLIPISWGKVDPVLIG